MGKKYLLLIFGIIIYKYWIGLIEKYKIGGGLTWTSLERN